MVTWITEYDKARIDNVKIIEERLSIVFPKDYLECALKYQGGHPSPCNIIVRGNEVIQFLSLLTFLPFDELDLLDTYNSVKKHIPAGLVPFALGSDSYLFCFDYRFTKTPTITLCQQLNDVSKRKVVEFCDSFTLLLERVH